MTVLKRPKGLPKKIPAWAWKWLKWRTRKSKPTPAPEPGPTPTPTPVPPTPKPKPKPPKPGPVQLFMYDDINVALIPANAQAVAGYVGGRWPTYNTIVKKWPNAKHLSIAVSAAQNARCLDVETGDALISQAPAWVKRQRARGEKLPVLYTAASWGQKLVDTCTHAGLVYGRDYLWWSAHYSPALGKHFCGPRCGFGLKVTAHATQFTDKALGRSLDESICSARFF